MTTTRLASARVIYVGSLAEFFGRRATVVRFCRCGLCDGFIRSGRMVVQIERGPLLEHVSPSSVQNR